MLKLLKKIFKIHEHERELFLIGNICLVKCVTCGAESIPWEVSKEKAEAAKHREGDIAKYIALNKKLEEAKRA